MCGRAAAGVEDDMTGRYEAGKFYCSFLNARRHVPRVPVHTSRRFIGRCVTPAALCNAHADPWDYFISRRSRRAVRPDDSLVQTCAFIKPLRYFKEWSIREL
ncbi:hypothetical protein EVAR_87460_1 [Eumeta japonica]|uniref:Uncharacterized protein n=1 Tax=Eumeta variegata TaxID=151549 RepID=A0A4C1VXM5_EUMVA|nr:hypothetical protein EVAR_87460_1 [Eumeta japonica]